MKQSKNKKPLMANISFDVTLSFIPPKPLFTKKVMKKIEEELKGYLALMWLTNSSNFKMKVNFEEAESHDVRFDEEYKE